MKYRSLQIVSVAGLILALNYLDIAAQSTEQTQVSRTKRDVRTPLRSAFETEDRDKQAGKRSLLDRDAELQPLEAPINPHSYTVGPGDVFQINVWSNVELTFDIPVNPHGNLTIPTVGTLFADGKTLAEVQNLIREASAKKYLQTQVTANLVRLRRFRVHVTGQVMNPGLYEALAVDRVSDVIEGAGGLTNWGSERAIEVRHLDGTIDQADLHRYKKLGQLESNVRLRGGDVIYVPSIQFAQSTVKVEGQVNSPGIYQLARDEALADFLLRVDAFNQRADLKTAYVERKAGGNGAVETIPIFPYLKGQGNGHSDLSLQDGDVIMIPLRQEDVYVVGAVKNPGPYPFYPNLRPSDYVGFAGGTEKARSPSKVRVIRRGSSETSKARDLFIKPGDTVFMPEKLDLGVREVTSVVVTVTNVLLAMKALNLL